MFEAKIDQLRTSKKELSMLRLDVLLFFTYLFSFIDLFLTYYVSYKLPNSIELNPIYWMYGWLWLLFTKLLFPIIAYYVSVKIRAYYPMYIMLAWVIFISFWNTTLLLLHL